MPKNVHIPVGTSNFAEVRQQDYYYIDKTGLIEELMRTPGTKVTLITRPRRFGKTMGMSMMAEFFDIRKDSRLLFNGLFISKRNELCKAWMNQYPTVFVSFRNVDGLNFKQAYAKLCSAIEDLYNDYFYLMESGNLNQNDKRFIQRIVEETATQAHIENSLLRLTKILSAHYGRPVILLIDEYDVPLAKASAKGYYDEMLSTVRGVLSVLKDNPFLNFAVITGCLQVVKESIFTGANNFVSDTVSDSRLDEYFGFTQTDVDKILRDTELTSHANEIKHWYNGYLFGEHNIYCPWDVMNHVKNLLLNPSIPPASYWEHTSHNDIIYQFISTTEADIHDKFETLLSGGYIIEPIEPNLTYDILHSSERNIWTLLYFTGYLTRMRPEAIPEAPAAGTLALTIPNAEIRALFQKSVKEWFLAKTDASDRSKLFDALWKGDAERLQDYISDTLFDTISYHDYQESFYHAFLAGLLSRKGYKVESNYENGLGRSDIVIKDRKNRRAAVIETKIVGSENRLTSACDDALKQIDIKQYAAAVKKAGYKQVTSFGVAFYQKQCRVKKGGLSLELYSQLTDRVETALDEAGQTAEEDCKRMTHEEVFGKLRRKIN